MACLPSLNDASMCIVLPEECARNGHGLHGPDFTANSITPAEFEVSIIFSQSPLRVAVILACDDKGNRDSTGSLAAQDKQIFIWSK
jgi:hypothetical protein